MMDKAVGLQRADSAWEGRVLYTPQRMPGGCSAIYVLGLYLITTNNGSHL